MRTAACSIPASPGSVAWRSCRTVGAKWTRTAAPGRCAESTVGAVRSRETRAPTGASAALFTARTVFAAALQPASSASTTRRAAREAATYRREAASKSSRSALPQLHRLPKQNPEQQSAAWLHLAPDAAQHLPLLHV